MQGKFICTALTSLLGSPPGERKCSFSAHCRNGNSGAQSVEEFLSVSPGLEERQTTPKRRRTGSYERRRGGLGRSRRPEMGSPLVCSPKAMMLTSDGGPPIFACPIASHSRQS